MSAEKTKKTYKPRIVAPTPIFDNLEHLENPFKLYQFNADQFFGKSKLVDGANRDYEYSWKFIYSYNGSSATFNVYRREIERLLQWAWFVKATSILTLKRHDIEEYVEFCQKPPAGWIGTKSVARFKNKDGIRLKNIAWRPFVSSVSKTEHKSGIEPEKKTYSLSQAGVQAIFSVLSSFFNFLIQEEAVEANPVMLIRQKSKFVQKQQHRAPIRRVSNLQWDYVIETAELLAKKDPEQHERTLFIMNCLYGMYLRVSELVADERATPIMGDFQKDMDGNWWFHVTGKGNKSRIITVSNSMLESIKRYRRFRGLTSLPTPDDRSPLIPKNLGNGPVTSTRQIRFIVQDCFDKAYERMFTDNLEEDAAELKSATVHWLRHTGISEDVKTRPREHVRDDAGHASMQTTDRYIESDLRERHASGRAKKMR